MNSVASQVGIDISKDFLDVSIDGGKPFRVKNNKGGIEKLKASLELGAEIHLESSGGHERLVRRELDEAGFAVSTHCPFKVRRMAQAKALHGKTDALDARHLSQTGRDLPAQAPKSRERESLCELSRAIGELKMEAAQWKVRAQAPQLDPVVKKAYLESAKAQAKQVKTLEKEFVKRVKASAYSQRYLLVQTIPGVGPVLAQVAVAELPDSIEQFTGEQITSYAGLAPMDRQSGSSRRASRIGHGNSRLKGALYMPALHCAQRVDWARSLYARLRARGRAHQQAMVAVMRRLLRMIVAVLHRGSAWTAEPPQLPMTPKA